MGRSVVFEAIAAARERGLREVTARPSADDEGFFARIGFRVSADQSWKWS
jgi:hypothetical protein